MSNHFSGVMAGLVPAIYVLLLPPYSPPQAGEGEDVDAREDRVPAASHGGVSLRGHDGEILRSHWSWSSGSLGQARRRRRNAIQINRNQP